VYNTYGELANWQLLHMYGFSELPCDSRYDAVSCKRLLAVVLSREIICNLVECFVRCSKDN